MAQRWTNWSGSIACHPHAIVSPADEAEIVALLRRAGVQGRQVRPLGAGHSVTPLVATDGLLLSLDRWTGIASCDEASRIARIRAGTRLEHLGAPLRERGLAMENLGDVDVQTLGGAIGTGTHGTGVALPNLSAQVTGVRLVTADGQLLEASAQQAPELLRAARVSLGALGVVSAVELRLLPVYRLLERVWRTSLADVRERLDELVHRNRHFEFFYFPRHDFAEVKTLNVVPAGDEPQPGPGERIGWSAEILPSRREQRFTEMEYSLPAEAGPACLAQLVERVRSLHPDVAWPLEYRTVAADDAWLSPAAGRPSVALSVHQDGRLPFRAFFRDVEPIFHEHRGRPHWGKFHSLAARELRELYPEWDAFQRERRRLDPDGRFLNDHLRALFGE